jgi:cytochrome c553
MNSRKVVLFASLSWLLSCFFPVQANEAPNVEKTVNTVCAACHGVDGNSAVPLYPKLAGQHPEYLYKQLMNFKSGARQNAIMSGMVAPLSEADMQALANYFSSQQAKPASAKSNGKGSLGEKIYKGGIAANGVPACASCHGANGAGLPVQFPRMSGQYAEYTVTQLQNFRAGLRANDAAGVMRAIAKKLTDDEMAAVADYIQGLR